MEHLRCPRFHHENMMNRNLQMNWWNSFITPQRLQTKINQLWCIRRAAIKTIKRHRLDSIGFRFWSFFFFCVFVCASVSVRPFSDFSLKDRRWSAKENSNSPQTTVMLIICISKVALSEWVFGAFVEVPPCFVTDYQKPKSSLVNLCGSPFDGLGRTSTT